MSSSVGPVEPGAAPPLPPLTWCQVDPDLAFHSPRLSRLLELWRTRAAAAGRLPRRADFDPLLLREHLGWLCIGEVLPDRSDVVFRLVGSGIVNRLGRDGTRMSCAQAHSPEYAELVRHVIAYPRPVRTFGNLGWIGKPYLQDEALVLPLAEDGVTVDQLLFGVQIE